MRPKKRSHNPFRTLAPIALAALALGASPSLAQPPFEQRPPQAPLDEPVEAAPLITAQSAWTCRFGMNSVIATQPMTGAWEADGPAETRRLIQNAVVNLRVIDLDADSGTATVEASFERLLIVRGIDDHQEEFRWNAAGDDPSDVAETGLERLGLALSRSTLVAKVGRDGTVRGVTGFDSINEAIGSGEDDEDADPTALGLFAPNAIGSTLELLWKPSGVTADPRNIGDEWSSGRRISLGPAGMVAVEQSMAIDRIEDGILTASGDPSLRLIPPADEPSAGAPKPELVHQDGKVRLAWDLGKGCTESASERLDLGFRWTLGPVHLGVTMRNERSMSLDGPPKGRPKPE